MKALSIASIAALALAGTAVSQSTETDDKAVEPTPAAAPVDDGFNLAFPGDTGSGAVEDDGFNFAIPSMGGPVGSDNFNLPMDVPATSGLDLPEIDSAVIEEITPEEPEEDEIIRLEP